MSARALIDSLRSGKDVARYREWGIPTAAAILEAKEVSLPVIATGGLRSGLQMAKAISLGADICGIALPFLRILSAEGISGVEAYVESLKSDFRHALFLTGCRNVAELQQTRVILGPRLKEWVSRGTRGG